MSFLDGWERGRGSGGGRGGATSPARNICKVATRIAIGLLQNRHRIFSCGPLFWILINNRDPILRKIPPGIFK